MFRRGAHAGHREPERVGGGHAHVCVHLLPGPCQQVRLGHSSAYGGLCARARGG